VRKQQGFTLFEVMIALAILALSLTVLVKSTAMTKLNAEQAQMIGVTTDLAREKMYEIEETLIKDGFSDTDQSEEDKTFADEGWPQISYSYKVEEVELPSWDQLQALAQGHAMGSGSGSGSGGSGAGSDESNAFADSALGGMMSQFGGMFGGGGGKGGPDASNGMGAAFIQGQYSMFQQILKVSIRKVTLTLKWQVMGSDRDMKVVCFFTDAAAMDKVISGMGSQDLGDQQQGSGSGSGSAKPPIGGGGPGSGK